LSWATVVKRKSRWIAAISEAGQCGSASQSRFGGIGNQFIVYCNQRFSIPENSRSFSTTSRSATLVVDFGVIKGADCKGETGPVADLEQQHIRKPRPWFQSERKEVEAD